MAIDPGLLDYCVTDVQRKYLSSALHQSLRAAAKECGVDERTVRRAVSRVTEQAAMRGYAPTHHMFHSCPNPFVVKGVSTLFGEDGNVTQQWVKTSLSDEARRAAMEAAVDALKETIPRVKPTKAPQQKQSDLLNLFVITDFHIGMRAWPEETRAEAWDTDIAEELLVQWFAAAIERSPSAETAVLAQLGDAVHYDGLSAVTPTSNHPLDSDTRYQRMVRVVIRVFRRVIQMLLETHQKVHVLMCEGNHDMASSAWLREVFSTFYEGEPRVSVDTSPDPHYCVEHGQTALFFHHGHLKKFDEVDRMFAAKFREVFGRTRHAYAHMGHYHHRKELETSLMIVRQHRTLAAADAYASRNGYVAGREAQVLTYHATHGEVGTLTISPEMVG